MRWEGEPVIESAEPGKHADDWENPYDWWEREGPPQKRDDPWLWLLGFAFVVAIVWLTFGLFLFGNGIASMGDCGSQACMDEKTRYMHDSRDLLGAYYSWALVTTGFAIAAVLRQRWAAVALVAMTAICIAICLLEPFPVQSGHGTGLMGLAGLPLLALSLYRLARLRKGK